MTDVFSPEKRSEVMSKIQGIDTKPEMKIRKALHSLGYRYRLHDKSLPGKPDIKLTKYNALIFVHGCFWHGHDCHLFKWPKTREDFWREKILGNKKRDEKNETKLLDKGWKVLTIWECALKGKNSWNLGSLLEKVEKWLQSEKYKLEIKGIAE